VTLVSCEPDLPWRQFAGLAIDSAVPGNLALLDKVDFWQILRVWGHENRHPRDPSHRKAIYWNRPQESGFTGKKSRIPVQLCLIEEKQRSFSGDQFPS
jgi:hypothetical protein